MLIYMGKKKECTDLLEGLLNVSIGGWHLHFMGVSSPTISLISKMSQGQMFSLSVRRGINGIKFTISAQGKSCLPKKRGKLSASSQVGKARLRRKQVEQ